MSPRLLPFTWLRYAFPALLNGALALVAWWGCIVGFDVWRQLQHTSSSSGMWSQDIEGRLLLVAVGAISALGQTAIEGRIRGGWKVLRGLALFFSVLLAAAVGLVGTTLWMAVAERWEMPMHTLALRWRLAPWLIAGCAASFGPWVPRSVRYVVEWAQVRWDLRVLPSPEPPEIWHLTRMGLHVLSGLAAGLVAALVWYQLGQVLGDRFFALAAGCWLIGAIPAALNDTIPTAYFRGWLRVVRGERPGWRVPLEPDNVVLSERFVGHFPTGLDVHLPSTNGVSELHLSVLAKEDGTWAARGLTQRPVQVRRLLEWVDLSYDPRLPAPLETPLKTGDQIVLGDTVVVEFVVTPREAVP